MTTMQYIADLEKPDLFAALRSAWVQTWARTDHLNESWQPPSSALDVHSEHAANKYDCTLEYSAE